MSGETQEAILIRRVATAGPEMGRIDIAHAFFIPAETIEEWWDEAERDYAEVHGEWDGRRGATMSGSSTRNS